MLNKLMTNIESVLLGVSLLCSIFLVSCATLDGYSESDDVNELAKEFAIAKLKTNNDNKRDFILLTEKNPLLKNPSLMIKTNNDNEKKCVFNMINNMSIEAYSNQAKAYISTHTKRAKSDLLLLKKLEGKTSIDEVRKKLFTISTKVDMSKFNDFDENYFSALDKLMYEDKYTDLLNYVKSPSPNFFEEKVIQKLTHACVRIE